jgi:hypothetical protein
MMRRLAGLPGAAMLAIALSVFVTWPQARVLSSHLAAHHDAYFSIWRLAWIAHALATAPLRLFNANIFHPATNTLAYSDATILEGLLGAPLFWIGLPPVLIYNLLLLAGFAGSGLAMFVLARHLTGEAGPAFAAAAVFTMLPYRIEHFMHLELQWAMFIPLTFWALHRAVETTSWRWGVAAGVFFWLQVLSCVYYGVFLAIALVVFVPAMVLVSRPRRIGRLVPALGAAALVAIALTVPYAIPYRLAARDLGERDLSEVARYSATTLSYFSASGLNRFWGWTADTWGSPELRLFPGFVALLLAVASALRRPARPTIVYALTAVTAVELSFGLNGTVYRALFDRVDALHGFRSLSRFAIVANCALAVLAALGTQALVSRLPPAWTLRRLAVPLLIALMTVEYSNRPMALTPGDPVKPPDVYQLLRRGAPGAILELPVPKLNALPGFEPFYQASSLWHWRPLVNGYSGYYPPDYVETLVGLTSFPDDRSIGRMRGHDVRYVIVHRSYYDQEHYTQLMLRMAVRPELKPWGAYRDQVGMADIFELTPFD